MLIGLISVALIISAIIWNDIHFSFFLGLLFNDAKEFANSGIITSNFMPIGYSGFLGTCLKVGGVSGVPLCQSFIYIGIIFSAFWFLKLRGVRDILLALGTLVVALHPMLVLNIWRIHDGNLTVFLLLGFLAAGVYYTRSRNAWNILALGVFAGLLITVRQNAILLFVPALFILWDGKRIWKKIDYLHHLLRAALFLASALVLMVVVNITVKGTPLFFAPQGPYNFFAGTNEYASKYLLRDFSGENSLGEALQARGFSSGDTRDGWFSFPPQTYKQLALDYVKNHPFEYVKLTALKLFTLLRPGYHMVENFTWDSLEGLKRFSKIILATPFFIWIFFVWKTRKEFFERENLFIFLAAVLYLLPFLIANADPRYRFPLDIILIVDSFRRIKKNPNLS